MVENTKYPVTFSKNDVEIIAREPLYEGFFLWSAIVSVTACLTAR